MTTNLTYTSDSQPGRSMGEPVAEGLELVEVANAPEVWQQETNLTKYMSESKFAPVQSPVPANEKHVNHTKHSDLEGDQGREKLLLGMRITTFWLLTAFSIASLAAILGGVLGSKAHCGSTESTMSSVYTSTLTQCPTSTMSTLSTVTSILPPPVSLSSGCSATSGVDWSSTRTQLRYKRMCNTFMDTNVQNYTVRFTSYQQYFDTCISSCDSYNFWSGTKNVTIAIWNWGGSVGETPGTCFCTYVDGDYIISNTTGHDSALFRGTFDEETTSS